MIVDVVTTNSPKNRTMLTFLLALANLMSFSVGIITAAILSRYMAVVEYGTYRQVIFIYTTLLVVFSMGLPKCYSYFLARVPIEYGADIVKLLNKLFFALSALFSIFLYLGADFISDIMGNELLVDNLRYFAITPMLLMPVMGVESILVVYGYGAMLLFYVFAGRLMMIVCTVMSVVVFDGGVTGAICGFVVSSAFSSIAGFWLSYWPFKRVTSYKSNIRIADIMSYSFPVMMQGIYGFFIGASSLFFVSRYFGVEEFALFSNGYKELPFLGMVIGAASGVIFPEFSRMSSNGDDKQNFVALWRTVWYKSSTIIYPLSVFCLIFAGEIMAFIYGENYRSAAFLFMIVSVIGIVRVVAYSPIMLSLGLGRGFANTHLVTAIMILALDVLCVNFFPSIIAIAIIATCCTVFCLFVMLITIAKSLESSLFKLIPLGAMSKILFASIISCLMARFLVHITGITNVLAVLAIGGVVYALIYFPFVSRLGVGYIDIIKPMLDIFANKFKTESSRQLMEESK